MRIPFLSQQARLTKAPRRKCLSRQVGRGFEQLEDRRVLATIPVTLATDAASPIGDGEITLREAITYVNTGDVPQGDRSVFDFANLGINDKIVFDSDLNGGTITLTQNASFDTRLIISQSVTIDASILSNGITINANDPTPTQKNGDGKRLLDITSGAIEIINLTLTGADVASSGGIVPGGGAIRSLGTLTIRDSLITGNAAEDGGGIYHGTGSPFGLTNTQTTLTIINSRIENNEARAGGGGGLMVVTGYSGSSFSDTATISGTTISNNKSSSYGGGIAFESKSTISAANLTINNGTVISDNESTAGRGGGIYASLMEGNFAGQTDKGVFIDNSTLSGNTSSADGGAAYINLGGDFNIGSHNLGIDLSFEMSRTTVENNQAQNRGGGLYLYGGPIDAEDARLGNNCRARNVANLARISAIFGSQRLINSGDTLFALAA